MLVEKPLAADLTFEAIAAEIAAVGAPTATGYRWRYLDTAEGLRELPAKHQPACTHA